MMMALLQLAVQSVEWTYSLYWRFSAQQRMLVWGDGFYNGPIKTTKTMHPAAAAVTDLQQQQPSPDHRTHQLRDLYNSLSADTLRRPSTSTSTSAALSPEDLTESEWFYLLCLSFSFSPGIGLPGNAFANNKHVWITGANEIDSKIFSRAILAKSAHIKTVVCIPLMDGVVELGTTDMVKEDIGFIQHIKSIFAETQSVAQKPAVSEVSTSNSATWLEHYKHGLYSNSAVVLAANVRKELEEENMDSDSSTSNSNSNNSNSNSNSNAGGRGGCPCWTVATAAARDDGQPSELIMQVELSEHIRLGSPDDASNNNFDYHPPPLGIGNSPPAAVAVGDTHYSNTLSAVLLNQNHSSWWPDSSSALTCSTQSAFSKWPRCPELHRLPTETSTTTSQCLLKSILHTVPFLHTKHHPDHNNPSISSQDKLMGNHFLAPRERQLNDKFIILRSIVPFATKMDKASILGDTVEYLKQLRQKIQDLEAQNREFERNAAAPRTSCLDKRKLRVLEGVGDGCITSLDTNLQVSIIGSDGLLELQCPYKEGLLLDILLILQRLRIETTAVRSSLSNGVFIAELRAKVKENTDGKKASILEVKRAIQQIIPCIDT